MKIDYFDGKGVWFVLQIGTGLMDGYYASKEDAAGAAARWAARFPGKTHILANADESFCTLERKNGLTFPDTQALFCHKQKANGRVVWKFEDEK